jgi:hypothetical protein
VSSKKNQMTLAQIKENLQSLIVEDLEKALDKFKSILDSESSYVTPTILHQANYNRLKKEIANDTISESNLNLRQNKIRAGFLGMLNDLEEEDVNMTVAETEFKSGKDNPQPVSPPQIDVNSGIYISYAWGGESEKIVDLLDGELQKRELNLVRDKRDLGYKGSIVEFMKDIGKGNKIIVVISEKYLKSENCMFELTQIYENKDFARRIFPIVLEDSNIYSPVSRIKYIKYWNDKIAELDEAIKSAGTGLNMTQIQQELNNYGNIRAAFDNMAFTLKDMNALTPEMHRNENFEDIYNQLTSS